MMPSMFVDKKTAFKELKIIDREIQRLSDKSSLATLDHKLHLRQNILQAIFSDYKSSLSEDEISYLKSILSKNHELLVLMEENKGEKSKQILNSKNIKKRNRIYTTIAKQK